MIRFTVGDITVLKSMVASEIHANPAASSYLLDLMDKLNFLRSQELHRINYEAKIEITKESK